MRIEDTDLERSDKKYKKDITENLKWLGLEWDEGPYKQSERIKIYQKYIEKLLDFGQAFYCPHTKEELAKERKEQIKKKQAPRHVCKRKGKKGIIRFRCPDKKIVFDDLIRGKVEFEGKLLGDIGIAKDTKTPLYNFAAAIDDIEMKISQVIRGEDHISNTPKQILIQEALGFKPPQFAHLPLILGADKSKMSKRHGATSMSWYKKEGYLPEAMINFMVLLGWNPGTEKEIFSLEELIKGFSLERVHKGGAIFNRQRLDWLNGHYIRQMDLDKLTKLCLPYLKESLRGAEGDTAIPVDYAKKVVALEQPRIRTLSQIGELTQFFFVDKPEYEPDLLIWKKMSLKEVKKNLEILEKELGEIGDFNKETLEGVIMSLTEKYGSGELLWPLRVALTGQKASAGPFEIMEVLGKQKTLKRIKEAIGKI